MQLFGRNILRGKCDTRVEIQLNFITENIYETYFNNYHTIHTYYFQR